MIYVLYNYVIPVCPLHYTPIFVGLNPNQICYRFWSIWYHRSRVLLKPCHNQCLGLCKALGFLLPLHLRPYPRSLVVERWFSDMATLTHGTSSIVNLPGWLPLKLEVQKKTPNNSCDTGYLGHLNPVTRLEGGKSRNEARNAGWPW